MGKQKTAICLNPFLLLFSDECSSTDVQLIVKHIIHHNIQVFSVKITWHNNMYHCLL